MLIRLFDAGCILDGEEFVEAPNDAGYKGNGMYSCFLSMRNAPEEVSCRRPANFWSLGDGRKRLTEEAFTACMDEGIPIVIDGDAPPKSPIGEMMHFASKEKKPRQTRLGFIGDKTGRWPLRLTPRLTDAWRIGHVDETLRRENLGDKTFTIDNIEVRWLCGAVHLRGLI